MTKVQFRAFVESLGSTNACTWCKKHQKVVIGRNALLSCRLKDREEDNDKDSSKKAGIDSFIRVCKINDWFEAKHKTHFGDHPMGRALQNLIDNECSSSVPRQVARCVQMPA